MGGVGGGESVAVAMGSRSVRRLRVAAAEERLSSPRTFVNTKQRYFV